MEIWKDVVGYEGLYQVSNLGRVKSLPRRGTVLRERILRTTIDRKGYVCVCFTKNSEKKTVKIHRLVAMAFIPNDRDLPEVNHKDENKLNNCSTNLEWCSGRYNILYNDRQKKIGEKLSKKVECVETNVVYDSVRTASIATGIPHSNIISACQGKYKQTHGYHFKYKEAD